jgi:hypothetical protein
MPSELWPWLPGSRANTVVQGSTLSSVLFWVEVRFWTEHNLGVPENTKKRTIAKAEDGRRFKPEAATGEVASFNGCLTMPNLMRG